MWPTLTQSAPASFKVAFLGFSEFERTSLASYFRLAGQRTPRYEQVATLTDADYLVADADHAPSVQLVLATEREAQTVFIGSRPPAGCTAWMHRPIDALHIMRELDAMVMLAHPPVAKVETEVEVEAAAAAFATAPRTDAATQPSAAPAPETRAQPPQRARAPSGPAPVLRRALVVDDSELALRFLESRLQRWPLAVDRATASGPAQALMAQHSYDLVFLDVELGETSELDGLGLCQAIKQSAAALGTTVILVSAHHSELDRVRGALAGCDAYLAKPLDDVALQRLLWRHGLKLPNDAGKTPAPSAQVEGTTRA